MVFNMFGNICRWIQGCLTGYSTTPPSLPIASTKNTFGRYHRENRTHLPLGTDIPISHRQCKQRLTKKRPRENMEKEIVSEYQQPPAKKKNAIESATKSLKSFTPLLTSTPRPSYEEEDKHSVISVSSSLSPTPSVIDFSQDTQSPEEIRTFGAFAADHTFINAFTSEIPPKKLSRQMKYQICNKPIAFEDFDAVTKTGRAGWLTTGAINSALLVCQRRNDLQTPDYRCSTLDSNFIQSVIEKNKNDKDRFFPRREDMRTQLMADRIFLPFNPGNHWVLYVIDAETSSIWCMESLGNYDVSTQGEEIKTWLEQYFRHKDIPEKAREVANYELKRVAIPKQKNINDCGVALIWAADRLYEGKTLLENGDTTNPKLYPNFRPVIRNTLMSCATTAGRLTPETITIE